MFIYGIVSMELADRGFRLLSLNNLYSEDTRTISGQCIED
jgi:hypothetical protein